MCSVDKVNLEFLKFEPESKSVKTIIVLGTGTVIKNDVFFIYEINRRTEGKAHNYWKFMKIHVISTQSQKRLSIRDFRSRNPYFSTFIVAFQGNKIMELQSFFFCSICLTPDLICSLKKRVRVNISA